MCPHGCCEDPRCSETRSLALMMQAALPAVTLGNILVRVFITAMKHHGQKQGGEEGVYLAYTFISLFIIEVRI